MMSEQLKRKASTQIRKQSKESTSISDLSKAHGNLYFLVFFKKSHKYTIVERKEVFLDEDDEDMGRVSHLGKLYEVKIIKKGTIKM